MSTTTLDDVSVSYITLGSAGVGTIQCNDGQRERLEEITERVASGEFHHSTTGTIPCTCKDGRYGATEELAPNAAGGSETLMVADDLTVKRFAAESTTTCGQYDALLDFLKQAGYPIGGHTAVELQGAPSGCGANDRLGIIYSYISENGQTIRSLAESFGYEVDDTLHETIIGNARARHQFSRGDELLESLRARGGRIDVLEGAHKEVVAAINRRSGVTLDRDALRREFGDDYQSFNCDEWTFEKAAEVISESKDGDEIRQLRTAMLYYNLATAGVLCGPDMRVVVVN